jgi:hypothetical protein
MLRPGIARRADRRGVEPCFAGAGEWHGSCKVAGIDSKPSYQNGRAQGALVAPSTSKERLFGDGGGLLQQNRKVLVQNDRIFAIYAFGLISCVLSLLACSVSVGLASVPAFAVLVEHVAMGLAVRAAYKSLDGSNIVVWALELSGMMTPSVDVIGATPEPA